MTVFDPPFDLTVIIPARNEEQNIAAAVRSFPDVRVIVVDDGSQDKTAEIARSAGAEVVPAPPLKKGLPGKPAACQAGAQLATTEWLLFVDADTSFSPQFLPSLLATARDEGLVMLTVYLQQRCSTLWDKIVMPYFSCLFFTGVNAKKVNSPASLDALANGQCILVRRGPYEFMGGHGMVARSIVEDLKLASLAKRHRMKVQVVRGEHLGAVRRYEGFNGLRLNFEKNSVGFASVNPRCGLKVTLACLVLTSYLPVLAVLLSQQMWFAAALFAILPILLLLPWYTSVLGLILSPLAFYIVPAIALTAMLAAVHDRTVKWKGRPI